MTPHSVSNTLSPVPCFKELARSAPQIQEVWPVTTSSWLYSAIAQVGEVEDSATVVAGMGDFRVQADAANRARQLLSSIVANHVPAPLVAPVSGGGLSVSWSVGDKEVKLAFDPDGTTYCFRFEKNEMLDDLNEEVSASGPIVDSLHWMMRLTDQ
jgi:hypothetical protein